MRTQYKAESESAESIDEKNGRQSGALLELCLEYLQDIAVRPFRTLTHFITIIYINLVKAIRTAVSCINRTCNLSSIVVIYSIVHNIYRKYDRRSKDSPNKENRKNDCRDKERNCNLFVLFVS